MEVIPFAYHDLDDLFAVTYVVVDSFFNCIVIDPSCDYDGVINFINKNNYHTKGVLLTHGHFDHMRGVNRICNAFNAPLYIEENDAELLTNSYKNCSDGYGKGPVIVNIKPITVKEYDSIKLLEEEIEVISTPYHTEGSCCYYFKDSGIIFTGDSLFMMAIGRSDLPTSISSKRKESINKIMSLPDKTKVYPGHGRATTIGDERNKNPFIKRL